MSTLDVVWNSNARESVDAASSSDGPLAFHRRLPGYAVTPLVDCADVAARVGLSRVWVKNESLRLELPSFKMLGASYAVYRALCQRLGSEPEWAGIDELRDACASLRPMALAAATDGNHGRAVARTAKLLGFAANIYVPENTVPARIAAIESEGATVSVVKGDYDAAVRRSAEDAGEHCLVISDTSWPGYHEIPAWVIEGYSTIFWELQCQLARSGTPAIDAVFVPVGVGALTAAAVGYFKRADAEVHPRLVGVEPVTANCVQASLRADEMVVVPGPHDSIMVGLNCGTPSELAWPLLRQGLDAVLSIEDEYAREGMRMLAQAGVTAGETGAAALGGLLALTEDSAAADHLARLGLGPESSVLVLMTEGNTDPAAYEQIVNSEQS
jgi:diaminopropionate ammonia-lyase